jgi:valyl-tRNA synthetase
MNLPKTYEPKQYEADIYQLWETSGAFKPSGEGEPYSIVMPPPNANGNLHIGHALINAVEDCLIRYHRMQGKRAIYIPGADHAGFETWVVYEKQLEKEGKSRFDFNRDELYQQTWDFVARNRSNMEVQVRELGASCDWSKEVFTLDDSVVKVAYKTFQQMWDDELIYRGERLVNYCTKHDTSFADIEVTFKDEKSHIWNISYPAKDGSYELVVATTRPETMFGDVAVAVHPDDKRYKDLIGKKVMLPIAEREIPIIADDFVDMEFGTGAVKITPAHDQNDFEAGERNNLERINIINYDGTMNEKVPKKYQGMTVEEARKTTVEDLKAHDFLVAEEGYKHSVGHCYKCGTVIQPLLKDQWFIKVEGIAKKAIEAIEEGQVKFIPENKGRVLINYLKNLRDWNISRQIPWGIPIPAFQNVDDPDDWVYDDRVDQHEIVVKGKTYKRDPDTFDTWFSSGQWPYITTKYHDSGELAEFFPNTVMETGHDILFPWVSRMLMMSLYVEEQVPFTTVYLHGLVLDSHGQKMSKSKGNVVNPQEIIEKYGSDALRIGLLSSRSAGQNQAFGLDKVVAGRNFANKLWNIARYIESEVGRQTSDSSSEKIQTSDIKHLTPHSAADHWIMRELDAAANEVASLMEEHRFSEAVEAVYHTIWDKLADWYLEASKVASSPSVMTWALSTSLKFAHPFAPFVTETIWQTLKWDDSLLITSSWPSRTDYDEAQAEEFDLVQKIIKETREVLAEIGTNDIAMTTVDSKLVLENQELIKNMSRVGFIQETKEGSGLRLTSTNQQVWLDLSKEQIEKYKALIEKKLTEVKNSIELIEKRLSNENYVKNAPEALVAESREELIILNKKSEHLSHQLKHL